MYNPNRPVPVQSASAVAAAAHERTNALQVRLPRMLNLNLLPIVTAIVTTTLNLQAAYWEAKKAAEQAQQVLKDAEAKAAADAAAEAQRARERATQVAQVRFLHLELTNFLLFSYTFSNRPQPRTGGTGSCVVALLAAGDGRQQHNQHGWVNRRRVFV